MTAVAMFPIEAGSLPNWMGAAAFLTFALLHALLAGKERNRASMWAHACSSAAFLLAAWWVQPWWSHPSASMKFIATLAALLAGLFGLARLVRLRAAPSLPETQGLREEKEQALGQLRESEVRLGRLVEEVREYAIFQMDTDGRIVTWNPGTERLKGWRAEEVLSHSHAVFYPEEEIQAGQPEQDLAQARAQGSVQREAWRLRKDGSRFMASITLAAIHDPSGRVTGFTKITRDITGRLEAEARSKAMEQELEAQVAARTARLQESEARLGGFIRHAPAAIAFKDPEGRFLLVNRRAEALLGRCLALTPDQTHVGLFPTEDVARSREQDRRVLTRKEDIQLEESISFPDGSERDFLIQKFPLTDTSDHSWGMGVIATDITDRKQVEQAQVQRQKMESLGFLAGGIAHDFNNLLGAMLGCLESAERAEGPEAAARDHRALEELIGRASTLVSQILAYSGKGKFQIKTLDLNRQVEEMTRILRASLAHKASILWEPAPDLPPIEGDLGQIQAVIMNLVLNASEAVEPGTGVITIRTGRETLSQEAIGRQFPGQDLTPDTYVLLEVSDNGPGMPQEVKERIFEPFYTTKFTGRGLGLAAVQGITRSHRGGVQVISEKGKGTTFRLFFPAASVPELVESEPPRAPVRPPPPFKGAGQVLVVDDEPILRRVAADELRRMGFEPLEAGDGQEALQVYEANRDLIVLVLMDLTMPRMDGEEAYRRLRRSGAMVPIILTSGFAREEMLVRFRGRGLAGFLPKPYRSQALVAAVQGALEGAISSTGGVIQPSNKFAVWLPEWSMGHTRIDRQHQGLVQAYNQVVAAVEMADGQAPATQALTRLIDQTTDHFHFEEQLMVSTGYANVRDHHGVHAHLVGQVQDLEDKIHRDQASFTPHTLNFLEDWVLCHMDQEDRDLAKHLKRKSPGADHP